MTKFVYVGGVSSTGQPMPAMTDAFKHDFPLGVPVEVTDPKAIEKLKGNKYFREATAEDEKKPVIFNTPKPGPQPPPKLGVSPPAPHKPAAE